MKLRKTDTPTTDQMKRLSRTSRFKETAEGWFFITREGITLGPYESEFDAELSASLLTSRLSQLEPGADACAEIQAFLRDPANAIPSRLVPLKVVNLDVVRRKARRQAAAEMFRRARNAFFAAAAAEKS